MKRRFLAVHRVTIFVAIAVLSFGRPGRPASAETQAPAEESPVLLAMSQELERSLNKLVMEEYEAPYFISYRIADAQTFRVAASYGAIENVVDDRYRSLSVDVRVGDYERDNSTDDGGFYYNPRGDESFLYSRMNVPIEDDLDALRQKLWLATDYKYKRALDEHLGKKGRQVHKVEEPDRPDDFSQEDPATFVEKTAGLDFDRQAWIGTVRELSARFVAHRLIHLSRVEFKAVRINRFFVSSEGSRLQTTSANYSLSVSARTRCADGMSLSLGHTWKAHHISRLPDAEELTAVVDSLATTLLALRDAPVMEPYSGPAIVEAPAAGVFFHEALGHRLEGHRIRREGEGHTFKDKLGEQILPEFLSVFDDPTLTEFAGIELYGHYRYDEQGIPARRVELVKNGVLQGFLMSRAPIKGIDRSNGHGRSDVWRDPVSRMGNLVVQTNRPRSDKKLKQLLIKECKKKKKTYGLVFLAMSSGETNTSAVGIQVLRARPTLVKKVYVKDGREELVRGVELIGTPLNMLENIIAVGNDPAVFNGVCGAESGWIPVSSISPSILISEVEVQKSDKNMRKAQILSPPLFDR